MHVGGQVYTPLSERSRCNARYAAGADGVVVGSYLVAKLEEGVDALEAAARRAGFRRSTERGGRAKKVQCGALFQPSS